MLIHKTMKMPTSCLSCWIAPTCEVWVREKSKYKGYDDRLDECPLEEVVRCKDCRHRDPEDHKCDCGALERMGCVFPVADDYFCAWGERREDDTVRTV